MNQSIRIQDTVQESAVKPFNMRKIKSVLWSVLVNGIRIILRKLARSVRRIIGLTRIDSKLRLKNGGSRILNGIRTITVRNMIGCVMAVCVSRLSKSRKVFALFAVKIRLWVIGMRVFIMQTLTPATIANRFWFVGNAMRRYINNSGGEGAFCPCPAL
jgi:hypothetical protein